MAIALVVSESLVAAALATASVGALLVGPVAPLRAVSIVGLGMALVLLLGYTAAVLMSLARGVRVSCRCFGGSGAPMSWRHVVRNLVASGGALAGLGYAVTGGPGRLDAGGFAVAAVVGCLVGVMVTSLDEIVDLFADRERAPHSQANRSNNAVLRRAGDYRESSLSREPGVHPGSHSSTS